MDQASERLALPKTYPYAGFHFLPVDAPRIRRVVQLVIGLTLFGISIAWAVEAQLGANPWTVFHEGVAERTALSLGTVVIVTGAVLLGGLWLFKEPLGLGTILNVLVIGLVVDATLAVTPDLDAMWSRIALLISSPILLGLGSGLYLGAGVGPGPRDGLMTALARRGAQVWKARTAIELTALAVGFALGGKVGVGTVWIAVAIGPCVQFFLPWFRIDEE